jgi:hypothetical protein
MVKMAGPPWKGPLPLAGSTVTATIFWVLPSQVRNGWPPDGLNGPPLTSPEPVLTVRPEACSMLTDTSSRAVLGSGSEAHTMVTGTVTNMRAASVGLPTVIVMLGCVLTPMVWPPRRARVVPRTPVLPGTELVYALVLPCQAAGRMSHQGWAYSHGRSRGRAPVVTRRGLNRRLGRPRCDARADSPGGQPTASEAPGMMRHCDGTDPNLRAEDGVTTPWSDAREPSGPAAGVTDAYSPGRPMAEPRQRGGLAGQQGSPPAAFHEPG